jgi:thiol-disulfide isomerase/thioredoxin
MAHRFLVVLFLASLPAWAQLCEAPSDVKAAMKAAVLPQTTPTEDRIAAAKKVREQFPADYFAHRFYQERFVQQGLFSTVVQEEYRELLNEHPDDLTYLTLYARVLVGTDTPAAIKLLDKILERQPDHPQAHLKLVEIYSAPAFRDGSKLVANAKAYFKACPSSVLGYSYLTRIDDAEFIRDSAAHLRELIGRRTDEEALDLYVTLWKFEFKTVPLSAQEPLRDRVRQDVERLRAQDPVKHPYLLKQLSEAYKILGDADGSKWVEEQQARNGEPNRGAAAEVIAAWHRAHPFKAGEEREAYQEMELKETAEWIRRWPNDLLPRSQRFMAMQWMQQVPLEDKVKAAEDWIRVYEAHPLFLEPYITVAQFYSQHNMRLDQLPDLLEKGLNVAPATGASPTSDLFLARSQSKRSALYSSWSTLNSAASIYLKIKKYDEAHELLAKLGPALTKNKPADSEPEYQKRQFQQEEALYWTNMGKWARATDHKLEALLYERNGILADPYRFPPGEQFRTSSLRALWKEINGSEDGFDLWMAKDAATAAPKTPSTVVSSQLNWIQLDKPLPDFEISDAEGKSWRLADLKGKVTLVNLWATWCGPCRSELPYLQKLFNKVRERKDLAVVTLNTDDNPGLILPFLNENKYTFPVLPAAGYVAKLVPELSIPRNWIVDADGLLRKERVGFGNGDDKWVDEMIETMEKARGK